MHLGAGKFLIVILVVLMVLGTMDNQITLLTRDKADNALIEGAFAGTLCDVYQSFQSIQPIKTTQNDRSIYDFEKMIKNSHIFIRENLARRNVTKIMNENVAFHGTQDSVDQNYQMDQIIVYNCADAIRVHQYTHGSIASFTTKNELHSIKTPNHIPVEHTSIYVRMSFDLTGILKKRNRVTLERYVILQYD